jgi:serine/threonine protein kinase
MAFQIKYLKYKNKYLNLKNKQRGGAFNLFEEGDFGCIYKIPHDKKPEDFILRKISIYASSFFTKLENEYFQNELIINKLLLEKSKENPNLKLREHLVLMLSHTIINFNDMKKDYDCRAIHFSQHANKGYAPTFLVLDMPFGGTKFGDFPFDKSSILFKYFINKILESLEILHKLGIIHNFFHTYNILIDNSNPLNIKARIIDFKLSYKIETEDEKILNKVTNSFSKIYFKFSEIDIPKLIKIPFIQCKMDILTFIDDLRRKMGKHISAEEAVSILSKLPDYPYTYDSIESFI